MTTIRHRLAVGLQWTGLVGATLGLISVPLFGLGFAVQWIVGGLAAVGLDVYAIRTESDVRRMLAAILKLVILVAALFFLTGSGTIPTPTEGALPPDTGPILLFLSILPSELGATLRKEAPMPEMGVPHGLQG